MSFVCVYELQRKPKNMANPLRHKVLKPRSDTTGSFPTAASTCCKQIQLITLNINVYIKITDHTVNQTAES